MHLASLILQSSSDNAAAAGIIAGIIAVYFVIFVIAIIVVIIPFWFICKKAGFSQWLSLLNLVPMGTLILLYILAFGEWKPPAPPAIPPVA
jgi:heme/copper-type cytochrome/quinol oxidase subunit 4